MRLLMRTYESNLYIYRDNQNGTDRYDMHFHSCFRVVSKIEITEIALISLSDCKIKISLRFLSRATLGENVWIIVCQILSFSFFFFERNILHITRKDLGA